MIAGTTVIPLIAMQFSSVKGADSSVSKWPRKGTDTFPLKYVLISAAAMFLLEICRLHILGALIAASTLFTMSEAS